MVAEAVRRLPAVDVVLEPLAVLLGRVVEAVLDLCWPDGDLGGEARAQLVCHDQDEVGVRDELDAEGPLALTLVAVAQLALDRGGLPPALVGLVEALVIELVEGDLLVAGPRLGLVDVGHL